MLRRHIKTVHPTRYREVGLRDIVEVRSAEITSPAWSDARARPRVLDSPYSLKFPEGRVVDYPKYRQESPVTSKSVTPAMSRSLTSRRDLGRAVVSRSVTPGCSQSCQQVHSSKLQPPINGRENLSLWRLLRDVCCHHRVEARSSITSEIGPAPQFVLDANPIPPVRDATIATRRGRTHSREAAAACAHHSTPRPTPMEQSSGMNCLSGMCFRISTAVVIQL